MKKAERNPFHPSAYLANYAITDLHKYMGRQKMYINLSRNGTLAKTIGSLEGFVDELASLFAADLYLDT